MVTNRTDVLALQETGANSATMEITVSAYPREYYTNSKKKPNKSGNNKEIWKNQVYPKSRCAT